MFRCSKSKCENLKCVQNLFKFKYFKLRFGMKLSTLYVHTKEVQNSNLYILQAWAKIVHCLIPNINELQANLDTFCNICGADEIVLFEKTTFLVIANSATIRHPDEHRFEKISSIIKLFNLCTRQDKEYKKNLVYSSHYQYIEKKAIQNRWKLKEVPSLLFLIL